MINKKIKITDIFGNKSVTSKSPFIILSVINDKSIVDLNILSKVSDNIWKYNMIRITRVLENIKIDPTQFNPVGYVYKKDNSAKKLLLLINKQISQQPHDFSYVADYKQGSLWRPIGYPPVDNTKILSLIYSPTKDKPFDNNISLINSDFLIQSGNYFNEFSLLNINAILNESDWKKEAYTINRALFSQVFQAFNFGLILNNDKYITDRLQKTTKLRSRNTSKDYQKIGYTVQGEFEINEGKCLTVPDEHDNIYLDTYNDQIKQKLYQPKPLTQNDNLGYPLDSTFISQYDNTSLSYKDDIKDGNVWDMELYNILGPDYKWEPRQRLSDIKYKGKNVVLVQSDNPWYLNKDIIIQNKYQERTSDDIKKIGKINSSNILDVSQSDLDLGGSYSRDKTDLYEVAHSSNDTICNEGNEPGKPGKGFTSQESFYGLSLLTNPLCWLIILILILIVVRGIRS